MIKLNILFTKSLTMKSLLTILAGLFALPALAQFSAGAYYNLHQPIAQYGENIGAPSQGVSLAALYRCSESPFSFGFELGNSVYNSQSYGLTFNTPQYGLVTTDIEEVDVISRIHVLTRYHLLSNAAIEPYAEGRIGVASFFTSRNLSEGRSVDTGEEVMTTSDMRERIDCVEHHGTGFQAGIGLGTIVNLKRLVCATVQDFGFELKLDMGVTYYLGTSTTYNGVANEINPTSTAHRSTINDLNLRLGLLLAFD